MVDSFSLTFKRIVPWTSEPKTWSCETEIFHTGKKSISYRHRCENKAFPYAFGSSSKDLFIGPLCPH